MVMKIRGNTQIMGETISDAEISASAAIQLGKIEDGNQLLKADGSVALTDNLDAGGFKLANLAEGTDGNDAVTKSQLDALSEGLDLKESVLVATTENLSATSDGSGEGKTLTADADGELSIDGVTLSADDRVLVKNQSDAVDNGIYVVTDAGATDAPWVLTRADDADGAPTQEVTGGMFTFVEDGSVNSDAGFVVTNVGTIDVDTDEINFTQFSGAGSITAGNGLTKSGNEISVGSGDGISVSGSDVAVNIGDDSLEFVDGALQAHLNSNGLETTSDGVGIASEGVTNGMLAGSIATSKLSDGSEFLQRDGSVAWTGDQDADSSKLTNLADGTNDQDAVTKAQLDSVSGGNSSTQTELDDTQTGAGLEDDGSYAAPTDTNWLDSTTSLKDGLLTLDSEIKTYVDDQISSEAVGFVDSETPTGDIDGSNDTFTLSTTPDPVESAHVYLNGLRQRQSDDFTISGDTITMTTAPESGDSLRVDYRI